MELFALHESYFCEGSLAETTTMLSDGGRIKQPSLFATPTVRNYSIFGRDREVFGPHTETERFEPQGLELENNVTIPIRL